MEIQVSVYWKQIKDFMESMLGERYNFVDVATLYLDNGIIR